MYVVKHSMKGSCLYLPVWHCCCLANVPILISHAKGSENILHFKLPLFTLNISVLWLCCRRHGGHPRQTVYQAHIRSVCQQPAWILWRLWGEKACVVSSYITTTHPPQALCTVMAFASQRSVSVCKQLPCTLPCVCLHSWGLNTWPCHGNTVISSICLNCSFAGKEWL